MVGAAGLGLRVRAVAGALVFLGTGFYSTFRHAREIYGSQANRSFSNVIKAMRSTSLNDEINYLKTTSLHFFSQYTVHYSLLTIHLVESHEVEVEPLNTLQFVATYPVPRALWPGKPASLGVRMVNDVLRLNVAIPPSAEPMGMPSEKSASARARRSLG